MLDFGKILVTDIKQLLPSIYRSVPSVFPQIYIVYIVSLGSDMIFCIQATLCLLTILIAAKGNRIVQLRYQKREKAVSLPKISINIFDVSKEG